MNNNSSQSRFSKITAKVIVVILAVVMAVSVLPALSSDLFTSSNAAVVYSVYDDNVGQINSYIANSPEAELDVRLYTDIGPGLTIPAGKTVNLFLNANNVHFAASQDKLTGVEGIINRGTLNIYSGSERGAATQNLGSASNSKSCIYITNQIWPGEVPSGQYAAYSYCEGIKNYGVLNLHKNVSVYVNSTIYYADEADGGQARVAVGATAIKNEGDATCSIDSAVITAVANGRGVTDTNRRGDAYGLSYGVYGGNVNMSGNTVITVSTPTAGTRRTANASESDGTARLVSVAYGIATTGNVSVTGGTINYDCTIDAEKACSDSDSRRYIYGGGILTTGTVPYIADANILSNGVAANVRFADDDNTEGKTIFNEVSVGVTEKMPLNGYDVCAACTSYSNGEEGSKYAPSGVTKGSFTDELGNSYSATQSTLEGSENNDSGCPAGKYPHPVNIYRGAVVGQTRIHIVYRYWLDDSLKVLDESITDRFGNKGISVDPPYDPIKVVKNEANFEGIFADSLVANNGTISYTGGGEVYNTNYWNFYRITYDNAPVEVFSEYDVRRPGNELVVINGTTVPQNGFTVNGGSAIIFIDYVRKPVSYINAKVNGNTVSSATKITTTYKGRELTASDIGLTIVDSINGRDYTSDYDFNFTNAENLIDVRYSYTGENTAGVKIESENGKLPKDAGRYEVTLHIEDSAEYSTSAASAKNRNGLEVKFLLVIEPANVTRGNGLPRAVSVLYGQKLENLLKFNEYTPGFLGNDSGIAGTYSFVNPVDGSSCKDVGTGSVKVLWTPDYPADAEAKNYAATEFEVEYNVAKGVIEIYPDAAQIVYGETNDGTIFTSTVKGIADNDNTAAIRRILADRITYTVLVNGRETTYIAGNVPVGEYVIRASFDSTNLTGALANYSYVCKSGADNPNGILTVNKRGLTVVAVAQDRGYEPDNYNITVNFDITDGKYADDEVFVNSITTTILNNAVGRYSYTFEKPGELAGEKAGNYYIASVKNQNEINYVNITKGTPDVAVPVFEPMYYMQSRTLSEIKLAPVTTGITGTWEWVNPELVPTVNVKKYQARFIPTLSGTYAPTIVDVELNIIPTDVVISYQAEIEYGDSIPNISDFSYSANNDPGFSIDGVETIGNISSSTDYRRGNPVRDGGYAVVISANDFRDVDGNYNFAVRNGLITVKPKVITYTVTVNEEMFYGDQLSAENVTFSFDKSLLVGSDTEKDLTTTGTAPVFTLETDYNYYSNYNAGEYKLSADGANNSYSPNYSVVVAESVLTVKPAPLEIRGNEISLVYGSAVPADLSSAFTVTGLKRADNFNEVYEGAITVTTDYSAGKPVTDEGYVIEINPGTAVFKNYEVTAVNGKINLQKANPVITGTITADIVLGQSLKDAVFGAYGATFGGADVNGTLAFEYPSIEPGYKAEGYTEFKAKFIPADTTNFNAVEGIAVRLTVTVTEASGFLAVTGVPMEGKTLGLDTTKLIPSDDIYTFTWYVNGVATETGKEFTLENTPDGTEIYVVAVPVASSNYSGSVTSNTVKVVNERTDISTILTVAAFKNNFNSDVMLNSTKEIVYDGTAKTVVFAPAAGKGIGEDVVIRYNGSTEAPVDAGTYTVTVDISAGATYSAVSGFTVGTLKINPKPYTVVVSADEKTYDGTVNATATFVREGGAVGEDDVEFIPEAVAYMFTTPDAGNDKAVKAVYTSCLTGAKASNYVAEIIIENNGSAVIEKRALDITVNAVSREYQDKNFDVDLDFVFTPVAGDEDLVRVKRAKAKGTIEGSINGTSNGVGIKNVIITGVEIEGERAGNYEITYNTTAEVEIVPAKSVYSVPVISGELYYDSDRTLKDISLGNDSWSWVAPDTVPQAGEHSYEVKYTPTDPNYAEVVYDIAVNVLKKEVIITADDLAVTYGDVAPTFRYTVKGLTGSDTIEDDIEGYVLVSCEYAAGTAAGDYLIAISGTLESNNYTFSYVNGNLTVYKRIAYVDAVATDREYEQGNTDVTVTFSGLTNLYAQDAGRVTLSVSSVTGKIESDTAGTKKVIYSIPALKGANADNYDVVARPAELTVEIGKASVPGIVLPTSGEVYYGYPLSEVDFKSGTLDTELGTFSMETPDAVIPKIGTFSNIFKVVFTPNDTENYATVSQYITIKVLAANISGSLYMNGEFKSGKTLEIELVGAPEDAWNYLNVVWYRVASADDAPETGVVVASGTRSYTLKDADSGSYIICAVRNNDNSPYICNAMCVSDYEIEERQLTFWDKIVDWFYNLIANFKAVFSGLFG